jgi:RNA polymerase sigma factor (TIGR02999 family)
MGGEVETRPAPGPESSPATLLLARMRQGDRGAEPEFFRLVYGELHALAQRAMRGERADHTLQATALVHEAWVRLFPADDGPFESRVEFLSVAARAMRNALVDHARARQAEKRGGARERVLLDEALALYERPDLDLLSLDEALGALEARDAELARLVELRFFAGLGNAETGRVLGLTERQVERAWVTARACLHRELSRGAARA